jgi:alpha-N-acetylglucosamine transferase
MLTIACVFSGGAYTREHVERLRDLVESHIEQPHRFVCVDDSPFPGWWAKNSLFEPGRFGGRVLYLDLDTTPVGSLDDLADWPYPFGAIRDYQFSLKINSSVMSWDAPACDAIFTKFTPEVMVRLRGDQDWIFETMPAITFPRRWCPSYKADVLPHGVPKDARVIVFHGSPRPWEVPCS